MADILPYLGVERKFTEEEIAGQTVILEDYTGKTPEETDKLLKKSNISGKYIGSGATVLSQLPEPGTAVPGGSQILLYLEGDGAETKVEVPDFTGMTRQQASDTAGRLGLYILVNGNSEVTPEVVVTAQSHPAKETVPIGTTITLEFTDTTARD